MSTASGHGEASTYATDQSPWRSSTFRWLLAGHVVSLFGDRVLAMVLGIWVKELTGSTTLAGLVYFAYGLPMLAAPFTGWVVDRYSRRTIGIAAQAAGVFYLLPLLIVDSKSEAWIIFAVTVCYGAGGALFQATRGAIMADVLPPSSRPRGNAILVTSRQVVTLVGPLLGAGLYTWAGPSVVVLVDVASFAVSAVLLLLVRDVSQVRINPAGKFSMEAVAGIRFLFNGRDRARVCAALVVLYSMIGMLEPVIFDVVTLGIERQPEFVSVLLFVQGVGGLLAGWVVARLVSRCGSSRSLRYGAVVCAASIALFIVPYTPTAVVGSAVLGASFTILSVSVMTFLQEASPPTMRGRVMAAANMLMAVPHTAAIALGSGLVAVTSFRWVLVGMTFLGLAAFFLTPRGGDPTGPIPVPHLQEAK